MTEELLVSIQMRFPNHGRPALAEHLTPVIQRAIAAGGITMNLSIQAYDPDDDEASE